MHLWLLDLKTPADRDLFLFFLYSSNNIHLLYGLYICTPCFFKLCFSFPFSLPAAGSCCLLVLWNLLIKSADWKTPGEQCLIDEHK